MIKQEGEEERSNNTAVPKADKDLLSFGNWLCRDSAENFTVLFLYTVLEKKKIGHGGNYVSNNTTKFCRSSV